MSRQLPVLFICPFILILIANDGFSEDVLDGPLLTSQPPARFDFSNGTGATLECTATGIPRPVITWTLLDGTPVVNMSGLRTTVIVDSTSMSVGRLIFMPFRADQFRPDVHTIGYRCSATNQHGTVISHDIHLKAVLAVEYDVHVYDEYAIRGNTAVLKCHVPSFLRDHVSVVAWIRDDTLKVVASMDTDGKFWVSPQGELYIRNVDASDRGSRYHCQTFNRLTNQTRTSTTSSRLMVTEPKGIIPPKIVEGLSSVTVKSKTGAFLPCVAQGFPTPTTAWMRKTQSGDFSLVVATKRYKTTSQGLVITNVAETDDGIYICQVNTSTWTTTHEVRLHVTDPLEIKLTPVKQTLNVGQPLTLRCEILDTRSSAQLSFVKDGRPAEKSTIEIEQVGLIGNLRIASLKAADKGMYQCFAKDGSSVTQATAQVTLGDFHPEFVKTFEMIPPNHPGSEIRLSCFAIGNPEPTMNWTLDGIPIRIGHHFVLTNELNSKGVKLSTIHVKKSRIDDGGLYACEAINRIGKARHSGRVNIYGELRVRQIPELTAVAGENTMINCPIYGYPIDEIEWKRDSQVLPTSVRQKVFFNGTLFIESILRDQDDGNYACTASNKKGEIVEATVRVSVKVAPKIVPFSFGDRYFAGVLVRISCVVYQGDLPLEIYWFKDGHKIAKTNDFLNGASVQTVDDFTSVLTIDNIGSNHSGNYTCVATNAAAAASHSSQLIVNVPPKIVPFSFQEEQLAAGMFVRVSCVVSRGDLPLEISWLKNGQPLDPKLNISTRTFDEYSSVLSINALSFHHNGNYSCVASNAAAAATFTAPLIVNVPPRWITKPDYKVAAVVGQNVNLDCQAEGFPKPTITWSKNTDGTLLEDGHIVFPNGTLQLTHVQENQEGYYVCKAKNGIGVGLDVIVHVRVFDSPVIVFKSQNQTVEVGRSASFSCVAKGDLPLNISWSIDGKIMSSKLPNSYKIKEDQAPSGFSSELTVTEVNKNDNVIYECIAQNAYGQDEATMKLIVQSQPDPPVFTVNDVGNQAVRVLWKTPFDGNAGQSLTYIIEYRQKGGVALNKTTNGGQQMMTISGLQPSATYFFRMFAENNFGRSNPTDLVEVVLAGEIPSGTPVNVEVQALDSQTIKVSWQPPPRDTWNGDIRGYFVGYRESSSTDPYEFQMLEVPTGYDKGLSFTIPELSEFTKYAIVIQAFNDIGKGPLSEEILIMTTEDVPGMPPIEVSCTSQSSSKIVVKWKPPAVDSVNGILRGYRVLHWPADAWDGRHIGVENSTENLASLSQLAPFTNYSVQVVAYTLAGDGIPSRPVYCRTWEDVPGSLANVKCVPGSAESVVVFWMPPQQVNGQIIHYTVYVEDPSNGWQAKHKVVGKSSYHEVQGLKRSLRYKFWVTASSILGEGKQSQMVYCGPAASFVLAKCVTFNQTFKVTQGSKLTLPCPAVGVPAPQFTWLHGSQEVVLEDKRLQVLSDKSLSIENVKNSDAGNYTCQVINDYGGDQAIHTVIVQVPPVPPTLSVTMATFNSFGLRWKPRANGDSPILGFILKYKPESGIWESVELQPYHDSYTLRNLRCGTAYEITIVAVNEVGQGENSDLLTVSTDGGVPLAPTSGQLIEESTTHCSLHLTSWVANGCPILYFTVEYKSRRRRDHGGVGSGGWTLVTKGVRLSQQMLVIADLTPDAWYALRMTAHSTAGTTVAEYDFATLPIDHGKGLEDDLKETITGTMSQMDFKAFSPILTCAIVILLCLIGTCIWVKRKRNQQDAKAVKVRSDSRQEDRPANRSTLTSLRRSGAHQDGADSDDDISPYAMVRLSDFQPETSKSARHTGPTRHSIPAWQHTPPPGMFVHHQPTAPPMSESYGAARSYPLDKGGIPQIQGYAQPLKGNKIKASAAGTHPPRGHGGHGLSGTSETTFVFPTVADGDYDPPPEFKWPFTKQ